MFLSDIQSYQQYSKDHPVYQLIDKFYNDHYVIQYFSGLIGGRGRRANLYGFTKIFASFNQFIDKTNKLI
jgi:ATP-dependent helicase/nuclease subunit A